MQSSRREFHLLLSALAATAPNGSVLPSETYDFASLPVKKNAKTGAESRQVFSGTTHEGCPVDLHITTMPPGQMPHPPHHHPHEEIMFITEGKLEVTISGKTSTADPGSVIYVHSMDEHGLKSVGEGPAQYFVLAIGTRQA